MEKITNKSALNFVIETYADSLPTEIKEKLSAMVVAIEKKSVGERKPTATQLENGKLAEIISEYLRINGSAMTITEMIKTIPDLAELSTQRVTPILKKLAESGRVSKEMVKGRAVFSAVVEG